MVEKCEVEKWKILEVLLKNMESLERHQYQYLGMNYSLDSAQDRIRFEYTYRNPQTVWISFCFYPRLSPAETRSYRNLRATSGNRPKNDSLNIDIVSPYRIDSINFNQWIKRYSSKIDVSSFLQFEGEFSEQAVQLIRQVDKAFSCSGIESILSGHSGIDIPTFNTRV